MIAARHRHRCKCGELPTYVRYEVAMFRLVQSNIGPARLPGGEGSPCWISGIRADRD